MILVFKHGQIRKHVHFKIYFKSEISLKDSEI